MIIDGTRKIAFEWLSNGELALAQGNKVIQMSPRQVAELLREIVRHDDQAIKDELCANRSIQQRNA